MSNKVQEVLEQLQLRLQTILVANGYNTDIGQLVLISQAQRSSTKRPSIAITSRSGRINRTEERNENGKRLSAKARRADIILEAAVKVPSEDADAMALKMLEDIERALIDKACTSPASSGPTLGLISDTFDTWQTLDRPEGIDAVVLQIIGSVDYLRPQ